MTAGRSAGQTHEAERRPRGAVRDGLVAAGLELARTGGPDAVVLREATRMVGVVPNAAYRHFADRDGTADGGTGPERTPLGHLRDVPDAARHHLDDLTLTFIDGGLA